MKENRKLRRRVRCYLFAIAILLSFFVYRMGYYWPKIYKNYKYAREYQQELETELEREEMLSSRLVKDTEPYYIARLAREKLNLSKPGEIIIKIAD